MRGSLALLLVTIAATIVVARPRAASHPARHVLVCGSGSEWWVKPILGSVPTAAEIGEEPPGATCEVHRLAEPVSTFVVVG